MSDSADDDQVECRHCGEGIPDDSDHRVLTAVEDGTVVYRHFCDVTCLDARDS